MVIRAVQVLCEYFLLVNWPYQSDQLLQVLDNALKWFYQTKYAIQGQKMSKSVKGKVDEQVVRESHQLRKQKIDTFCAAIKLLV